MSGGLPIPLLYYPVATSTSTPLPTPRVCKLFAKLSPAGSLLAQQAPPHHGENHPVLSCAAATPRHTATLAWFGCHHLAPQAREPTISAAHASDHPLGVVLPQDLGSRVASRPRWFWVWAAPTMAAGGSFVLRTVRARGR